MFGTIERRKLRANQGSPENGQYTGLCSWCKKKKKSGVIKVFF